MNANDPVGTLEMLKYSIIDRFVLDPVSDPVSDPDSNPDPKCLFRIRIGSGQKFRILPDPQHCLKVKNFLIQDYLNVELNMEIDSCL